MIKREWENKLRSEGLSSLWCYQRCVLGNSQQGPLNPDDDDDYDDDDDDDVGDGDDDDAHYLDDDWFK